MDKLIIKNIRSAGMVTFHSIGNVWEMSNWINCELLFGKCYCFDTELTHGGWGLSWIIAGQANQYEGDILYRNKKLTKAERRKLSQCVGLGINDHFFLGKKTIRKQLLKGLKVTKYKNAKNIEEFIDIFKISKEKIDRTINHVGAMLYKASMAIGYAFDKKIYCFPWIEQKWVLNFKDLWLKELTDFLKQKECLIIIPTRYSEQMKDLFDEIVDLKIK